jgi:hypothetical protein
MPRAPRPDQFGPDPEPLGVRLDELLARVSAEYASEASGRICPLSDAVGKRNRCTTARCPYYRVPGTTLPCAVDQWSPRARRDPRIARWFEARREEILRGRSVGIR